MDQSLQDRSLSATSSSESIRDGDISSKIQQTPLSTVVTMDRQRTRETRHTKRLSLHFPILIPSNVTNRQQQLSATSAASATRALYESSSTPSPTHSYHVSAPSPLVPPMPLTPPSEWSEDGVLLSRSTSLRTMSRSDAHRRARSTVLHSLNPGCTPDFLTLLASQERRVLELREELIRAEGELAALKKSWAVYESSRKKIESKVGATRLSPIQQSICTTPISAGILDSNDEEYSEELKKEMIKQQLLRTGTLDGTSEFASTVGRKPSQRVFSGSRHTRALSLLTAHNPGRNTNRTNLVETTDVKTPDSDALTIQKTIETPSSPAASNISFDSLASARPQPSISDAASGIAREPTSLSLGKTYKDLASAASKRTIPQGLQVVNGGAEVLVKQGKMVVDGVRDGLWNFFEDIRQATVGEEAAREIAAVKKREANALALAKQRTKPKASAEDKEPSFWKEFGIDTPKGDKSKTSNPTAIVSATSIKDLEPSLSSPQGHTRNFSKPLTQLPRRDQTSGNHTPTNSPLPVSTNPDDAPIEPLLDPDLDSQPDHTGHHHQSSILLPSSSSSTPDHSSRDHESKSSTDSGDSHCTPSLVADSVCEEGDDDIDDEEVAEHDHGGTEELEPESWEWDTSMAESPLGSRVQSNTVVLPKRHSSIPDAGDWHSLTS